MQNKITLLLLIIMTTLPITTSAQQQGKTLLLWPNGAPNRNDNPTDTAKVTVYLPPQNKATGRAIVVCPGGGYTHLAMQHEGHDWAPFFIREGIAIVVLKYRMPRGNYRVPISDAEEALRMVRRHAKAWHIAPGQVGIMGFSAGGHLASAVATQGKGDAKPDFQLLFYPVITMDPAHTHRGSHDNLLGAKPKKKLEQQFSNELQVTRITPRAFIALSDDDDVVQPLNGVNYYLECLRHDVPASLHVYHTGGHGWGYRDTFDCHIEMLLELKAWLKSF